MYKTIRQFLVLGLAAVFASSCVTQKQLTYLRDADASKADSINAHFTPQSETIIRNGDALTIMVNALDREAVLPYNMLATATGLPGSGTVQTTPMMQYYVVDEAGEIEMPVIGKLHVAGLKRTEVEELVKSRLEQQVMGPLVHVDLINSRVTVMGEVKSPRQVPFNRGRLTILEALAAAGDLTNYGRRDNVLVTREVDGKLELARVDLGSADLYTSPYYYLQQNDVVYVSPNKVRAVSSTNAGIWISLAGTIASTAAMIVTVVLNVDKSKSNNNSGTGTNP